MYTINCKGRLLVIDQPLVMGIINITPDSFYEKSRIQVVEEAVKKTAVMVTDGATIIDIGGQSSRPGSVRISAEEETDRVAPVIEAIKTVMPDVLISIDTYSSTVAEAAVKAGAAIINDISGSDMDENILSIAATYHCPYICMHMQGTPESMQQQPQYENVTAEVLEYLSRKIALCKKAGIKDVMADPGFGFGKTIQHNFTLLRELKAFAMLDVPLLVGISRKSTIYKTLGITADEALNGTTVLNSIALMNGAHILRVHDVKAAVETVRLFNAYRK